ncbi:MAG: hypothetical protein HOG18_00430 [Proteobacteria bacterium]|nr:hypothetical protein [Pseudomonadota bacterium]MBT5625497.1 hypothetical protein [Pseudomonadota bacterium]MBT7671630.1 hypothetical protein [Pseudomonadota bacterium]MBT7812155.1 hypothetical protein [Pseudomonadota bacterium]MBT7967627.1 hypothetical protein [Pseudomonadota bacterium]
MGWSGVRQEMFDPAQVLSLRCLDTYAWEGVSTGQMMPTPTEWSPHSHRHPDNGMNPGNRTCLSIRSN